MAFPTVSLGKSSEEPEKGELCKSMKDSKEMLSFTLARMASWHFRMRLAHIADAVLATNSCQRVPATKRRLALWRSLEEESAMDLATSIHQSIQEVTSMTARAAASKSLASVDDNAIAVLFRFSNNFRSSSSVMGRGKAQD